MAKGFRGEPDQERSSHKFQTKQCMQLKLQAEIILIKVISRCESFNSVQVRGGDTLCMASNDQDIRP